MLVAAVCQTVASLQSGAVINALIARNFHAVILAIVLLGVFDVSSEIASQAANFVTATIYHDVRTSVAATLFAKAQRLPLSDVADGRVGELLSRTTSDADAFASLVCYVVAPLAQAVFALAAALAFMFHANPLLAGASLTFVPLWIAILAPADTRMDALRDKIFKLGDRLKRDVADAVGFTGLLRVKSYGAYHFDLQRFQALNVLLRSLNLGWFRANARKSLALSLSAGLFGHVLTLAVGSMLVAQGRIDVGTLVAFLVLLGRLYGPIQTLAHAGVSLSSNAQVVDRVADLLSRADQAEGRHPLVTGDYEVEGLHLSFDDRVVFEDVALSLTRGEWVAIVGENGSGKTALVRMLPRLFESFGGTITYGGTRLDQARLADLRQRVVMLPQHDSLFNGTVRDNVAYGGDHPDAALWAVLEMVEMAGRIRNDPGGLDAVVRPLGTELSSGERQRLVLARAILRAPEVLIIDEATSNIDIDAERRMLGVVRRELNCAVVYIAHRDTGLDLFDRVVRLQRDGLTLVRAGLAGQTH